MIELEVDGEALGLPKADLFFQPEFFALHRKHFPGHYFRALDKGTVVGVSAFFAKQPGHFESPLRGSYGGFWMPSDTKLASLEIFVEKVTGFLIGESATRLSIVLPPLAYDPAWTSSQFAALSDAGFRPVGWEVNQHLPLCDNPFRRTVLKEKRRQLNKLEKGGIVARIAESDSFRTLYELLAKGRKDDVPLSMTWPQVAEMFEAFPERVLFIEAVRDGAPIAAVLALILNERVVYTLYYGNELGAEGSPVLVALQHLYEWSLEKGLTVLDLGASSIRGQTSHPIYDFKASIGARPSMKFWMERDLRRG